MLDPKHKAKLSWHCRRGMLELDLILQEFLENDLNNLSANELQVFESLLTATDPELYAWLMGQCEPPEKEFKSIVDRIRNQH